MTDLTQEKLEELKGRYDKCVDDNGAVTLRLTLAPSVADPMALTIKLEEEQRAFLSLLTDLTPDLIAAAERDMEGQADTERRAAEVQHAQLGIWTENPGVMVFVEPRAFGFGLRFKHGDDEETTFNFAEFRRERLSAAIDAARAKGEG